MRTLRHAFMGLAIAVSAFAMSAASAQAAGAEPTGMTKPAAARSPRCTRWVNYCHTRHPVKRYRYRACLALHGCRP